MDTTNASSNGNSSSSSSSSSSGGGTDDQANKSPSGGTVQVAMDTLEPPSTISTSSSSSSSKTLKRCLSVPIIRTVSGKPTPAPTPMTTRSAAAAAAAAREHEQTPKKREQHRISNDANNGLSLPYSAISSMDCFGKNIHIRSQPNSREVSPAPMFNLFTPRARRYSASYSPALSGSGGGCGGGTGAALCMTPRISQLRQEGADLNSREMNHEREVHREIQISQSWEDLTLVAENWSCKSDEFSNPLQVVLPTGTNNSANCSSPSPTNNRACIRLPYSPSPTRRTFSTRRSMSPIAMRPSSLGPVKRKFELEDSYPSASNWSVYSPPAPKKIFTDSRGSSPVCQSPSSVCPSPDSGTYDGRNTPKLFISKLCTNNNAGGNNNSSSSGCPSPASASPSSILPGNGLDAMCQSQSIDEGISIPESEHGSCRSRTSSMLSTTSSISALGAPQLVVNDMVDDATLMDDAKSETSSIGGCSTISIESSSCDSGARAATFLNRLAVDDCGSPVAQKSFYINKQGLSGAKKFIVNHEKLATTLEPTKSNKMDVQQKL